MKWYELKWRKFEMKFLGKKYCNYKTRHGHYLVKQYGKDKGIYSFIVYKCSVCDKEFIADFMGLSKV